MELDLYFMIIYLSIKYESNTLIFSKDIKVKTIFILDKLPYRHMDIRTDSGDTICTPIENGGGITKQ